MTATTRLPLGRTPVEQWLAWTALLLFPAVMMQVGREWTAGPAAIAGGVIAAILFVIELLARKSGDPAYRAGTVVAFAAAFLLTWITLVASLTGIEENPADVGFFTLVLAAGVSAFAVRARADGMARAMLGIAALQAILGALAATDPRVAAIAGGVGRVTILSGYFVMLWLSAAACFRHAARRPGADL